MASVKPAEVSAILKEQLSGLKTEAEVAEVGTVLQVGDGIDRVYGLSPVAGFSGSPKKAKTVERPCKWEIKPWRSMAKRFPRLKTSRASYFLCG